MSDLKVTVDAETCSGCGVCEGTAPEVFAINDDGVAQVQPEGLANAADEEVVEAAEGCPCEAILVVNPAGEQVVPA
jgi:ferredoxin